jgi:hypothetical protein
MNVIKSKRRGRRPNSEVDFSVNIKAKAPKGILLKKGDYVYNTDSGEEWLLLEDLKEDLSINCICTYTPAISRYKVGANEEFKFYYNNGGLAFQWKKGKNKNH